MPVNFINGLDASGQGLGQAWRSPVALLFFSDRRRFFNACSSSSLDRKGRTLGPIFFPGTSVVVVETADSSSPCSWLSGACSPSTYSSSWKLFLKLAIEKLQIKTYIIDSLCGGRWRLLESISLPSSLSQQAVSLLRVLRCRHIHQQQQRDSGKHQTAMAIRIWPFSCIIRRDTRAPIVRKLCTVQYILACVGGDKQVLSKKIAFYATRARNVIRLNFYGFIIWNTRWGR